MKKNMYQILGISSTSDMNVIKRAYRKLAKRYHPDTNVGDKQAEIKFKEIKDAYELLSDQAKREAYDEQLNNTSSGEQSTENSGRKGTSHQRRSSGNMKEDLENQFEQFFGYNPKTKEKMAKGKGDNNPMDTSQLFGSFFKMGKK